MVKAVELSLNKLGNPRVVRTDMGGEFRNKSLQSVLKRRGIKQIFAHPPTKACFAERFILTLKRTIFRYLRHYNTFRYVDKLQNLLDAYNKRIHRSLGLSPNEVNYKNEARLWNEMYINRPYKNKFYGSTKDRTYVKSELNTKTIRPKRGPRFKFKLGQLIRISHGRGLFDRGYDQKFSEEIFKVSDRFVRTGVPLYRISDL